MLLPYMIFCFERMCSSLRRQAIGVYKLIIWTRSCALTARESDEHLPVSLSVRHQTNEYQTDLRAYRTHLATAQVAVLCYFDMLLYY